ncbi:MAG: EF-P beta-lysylation protein EpmB [endosymbiont of Galathealinum brachiosum]|uniref:L-lysine 2,3-aminomutase n=1 Tax=endosymbiont of Galathealinum brachiosum TaxID=2200906 RepID=A0A370DIW8_9GAMM|nr:MAG: EF-P beta-lysylation protein EpmB [endosymbiont of Galathealinum brachiosum]
MPKTITIKSENFISNLPISWQQQLSQAVSDPDQLLDILNIKPDQFPLFSEANQQFSLKVPHAYINKIQKSNARDPLLLQIMTQSQEMLPSENFHTDPVGDLNANKTPGLLHKYNGRVLLITTGACAVHCRYCFRRHFPYQQQQAGREQWSQAINYIQHDKSIKEVILSGGDPLVLSDKKLDDLVTQLENIPHITRLRIHSRLPVVLPDRITDKLVNTLSSSRFNVCLVIHANHANEITDNEVNALDKLKQAGIHLLNQAVLLKDINHHIDDQVNLSETLFNAGVLPYYLHLLDPVQGAAHFDVKLNDALCLMTQMQNKLPGFLVPRLVREIAGETSKTPANEL